MATKFPRLEGKVMTIDVETTGLKWWEDKIFGVAISTDEGDWYWDVRREPKFYPWLREWLPTAAKVVNHNIKFDGLFLRREDVDLPWERVYDTMIQAALIDEAELSYDLDYLGRRYTEGGKATEVYAELATLFGGPPSRKSQAANLHRAPKELVARYAKQDTRTTLALYLWQVGEIERQDLHRVLDLERQLLPVVVDLEWEGVRVDVKRAEHAVQVVSEEIREKQARLDSIAGFPVNPNPSNSIHKLFEPRQNERGQWVLKDGTTCEETDGGKASLNKDTLQKSKLPEAALVLDVRQLIRMKDVFLEGHILGNHVDGLIHCNMNQTKGDTEHGTGTGRFSIDSPALQQIPKRNKRVAEIVRSVFIPDPDHQWLCADYKQFEFRWFAHFSKSRPLIDRWLADPNADPHQMVADLTGLPRVMTPGVKGNAKQINLGLTFGMGEGRLAAEMGLPYTTEFDPDTGKEWLRAGPEAKNIFARYHSAVPGIKQFLERAAAVAKDRGYVITAGGRHIRCGYFPWKAGGLLLQGSAADALKWKMIDTYYGLRAAPIRLMLPVHDELNFSSYLGYTTDVEDVRRIMEDFGPSSRMPLRVPIRTDPQVGDNWWEASKD